MISPVACSECNDRSMMVVRCALGGLYPSCNAPGTNHLHMICSQCGAEHVSLLSAAEMACLASPN
jgi:hypothetical protein